MKHTRYLLALLAVAAGISACEEPLATPVIQVAEPSVTVNSEGGEAKIAYTVENAVEGVALIATAQDEWINSIEVKKRVIEFTVDKNDSGALRNGTITLEYEGAASVEVTVTQELYNEPLRFSIDNVDATSVTFSVYTQTEDFTWIAQFVPKEWYESKGSEKEIFEADLAYFAQEASYYGVSLKEYLSKSLNRGTVEQRRHSGLDPNSEWVFYVYGISTDGEPTTGLYTQHFKTDLPYEGAITFEFNIKEEKNAVLQVTCTPSHEGVAYYWDSITPEVLAEYGGTEDMNASIQKWFQWRVDDYIQNGDYASRLAFYEYYTNNKQSSVTAECLVNTEYIYFAFKWDAECNVIGDVSYVHYTTGGITPSENVITVTTPEITQSTITVEAKTTNDDPYFIIVEPVSEMADVNMTNDDEIFHYFYDWLNDYFMYNYISWGNMVGTFYELTPNTEYNVITFGYQAGALTTPVQVQKVKTLESGDPKDCEFEFEITNIKNTSAEVAVKPSDKGHWYYWDVFPANMSGKMIMREIEKKFDSEYYSDMWEFMNAGELAIADSYGYLSYLTPDTDYKIAAVIIEADIYSESYDLNFLSLVTFSEVFHTPEMKISSTTVTCGFPEYYDGDEIAELEPDKFGGMVGKPYLPLSIEIEGDYSEYYYTLFDYVDGLDDPAKYPDTELYEVLMDSGWYTSTSVLFTGKWESPLMLAAMAVDLEGNYSKVYRSEPFTLTKSGAGPAENFLIYWDSRSSAPKLKSVKANNNTASKTVKTKAVVSTTAISNAAVAPKSQMKSPAPLKKMTE